MSCNTADLQFVLTNHSQAEIGQNVCFYFEPSSDYIELKFDAPQDEPLTGWSIKAHIKPARVSTELSVIM